MIKASSLDASSFGRSGAGGQKMMRKLFSFFLNKNLSSENEEEAVESSLSYNCFRFFPAHPALAVPTGPHSLAEF